MQEPLGVIQRSSTASPANTVEPQQDAGAARVAGATESADRSAQLALLAFVAVLGGGLVLFLVFGHSQWFFLDDWDFLADRRAADLGDLLRPHNEHWSTLPILVYRLLWQLFGLRTYVPYQLVAILLHLTAAVLLRLVMRRAGVGPWIATVAASLFALFGAGDQNIVWAFQMAWSAALVLGLTQLVLADHDDPIDRRDWLGLLAGLAGLLCSGVAVTMVAVVGLSVLVRRGWRAALFHTAPLGLVYVVWWLAFARDEYTAAGGSIGGVVQFIWNGVSATFGEIGQLPGFGILVGVVLALGLVLAWGSLGRDQLRRQAAAPGALLVGSVFFLAVAGVGRAAALGPETARFGRYVHIVAALALPAIAVAADAFMRRSRLLGGVAAALLLVGIPGNVDLLVHHDTRAADQLGTPELMLAIPRVPPAEEVPRSLRPNPEFAFEVTVGWLLDGVATGRVPDPGVINPFTRANVRFRLSFLQSRRPTPRSRCRVLRGLVMRTLTQGQMFRIDGGPIRIAPLPPEDQLVALTYTPTSGHTLVVIRGPVTVRMGSAAPSRERAVLCE
jgi:hypothetical protein